MNFEDEEYVRVYSKKTITFKRLGWEGRTVLWHLMLEADRAGCILLGEGDEVEAVTVLIDLPEDVVRTGLLRLSSQGVTSRHGPNMVINRFVEAQEARRSDRLRALEYRDRQKAKTVTERDGASRNETQRDDSSRSVTERHDSSLPASPPLSPASPQSKHVEFALDAGVASGDSDGASEKPKPDPVRSAAKLVFESWKHDTGHYRAVLDRKREARIVARLRDGFTPDQLILAIKNRRNDTWLTGERSGRVFDGIETLLRDRAQVERLLELVKPMVATRAAPESRQPDRGTYNPADNARRL